MKGRKIEPLTYQQLDALSRPASAEQPEGLSWVIYDTQSFTTASTNRLEYFTSVQSNKSLGNLDAAGQFTRGQYFMIHSMGLDVTSMVSTAAGGITGSIDDVAKLLMGDAGTGADSGRFTFTMLNKTIGPFPLSFLHGSGGPTGFGWGTFTAEESLQYGNNGVFDGGFDMARLVIPPNTTFSVVLEWGGTVATTLSPVGVRVWMAGTLYRPIR